MRRGLSAGAVHPDLRAAACLTLTTPILSDRSFQLVPIDDSALP